MQEPRSKQGVESKAAPPSEDRPVVVASSVDAKSSFADKVDHIKDQLRLGVKLPASKAIMEANAQLGLRVSGNLAKQVPTSL